MLSPKELKQVAPAETSIFPSPIPVQCVSSDEYMPCPQTEKQREFEARVKEYGAELARKQGVTRRTFFKTAAGMAAAFVAMNDTYGPLYAVSRAEAAYAGDGERAREGAEEPVHHGHAHPLPARRHARHGLRRPARDGRQAGWNPMIGEKEQTIEDLKFANYFKEIYLDSDTKVACISGSYSVDEKYSFLTNDMKYDGARKGEQGSRHQAHVLARDLHARAATAGWTRWRRSTAKLKPDSWKGYTIGDNTNKHLSKWPFRLDDEKIMYPFYEKLVKWSKTSPTSINVCIHKGLFPPEIEAKFPHLLDYSDVRDVGKAAKDWPQLNFIIYHSGWRWTGAERAEGGVGAVREDRPHRVGHRSRRDSGEVRREERLRRPRAALRAGPPSPTRGWARR